MLNDEKDIDTTKEVEDVEEGGSETGKPEKKELSPEQIEGIERRQLTKLMKKFGIEAPKPKSVEQKESQTRGFDYGEKAFLKASGVQNDEYDYIKEVMDNTGKSLEEVLESKYVQSELKERREAKASAEALPSSSKRSGSAARDTVEYWIRKGELPPRENVKLRREVVKARVEASKNKSKFSSNPIV